MEFLGRNALKQLQELRASKTFHPSYSELNQDERVYLMVEQAIRDGRYSEVDAIAAQAPTKRVHLLSETYRDLFTNAVKAFRSVEDLLELTQKNEPILQRRLSFWQAHLKALLGEFQESGDIYAKLNKESLVVDTWQIEEACLIALFQYLSGESSFARESHYLADQLLGRQPDSFLSVFNSAMALRTAIKLSDAEMFDHFIQRLESSATETEFKRFRLRQLGYRAIILAQNGDLAYSNAYWSLADQNFLHNESPFEAGQYLILRGLGSLLSGEEHHQIFFERARNELLKANSTGPYLFELEFAELFSGIANPWQRGRGLEDSIQKVIEIRSLLVQRRATATPSLFGFIEEGIQYCDHLLKAPVGNNRFYPKFSLVLNILENSSNLTRFDASVSHYRAIPSFVRYISEEELNEESIVKALARSLRQRVTYDNKIGKINLENETMLAIPDVKVLLGLAQTLMKMRKDLEESSRASSLVHVARQVSHDIRSPLSALDVVFMGLPHLEEEKRVLARLAITRIKDIANNLLNGYTKPIDKRAPDSKENNHCCVLLCSALIDELVSEKRAQYRNYLNIDIDYQAEEGTYGLFVDVDPVGLKRVLSNLINNAVEALPKKCGKIRITLKSEANSVVLELTDNGIGIPEPILRNLGKREMTFGKSGTESGYGLGIYHAFSTIKSFRGEIKIESLVKKGTSVFIKLPQAQIPTWFVEELKIKKGIKIAIVDDDVSIHQIWQSRFDLLNNQATQVEIFHFSSPQNIYEWLALNPLKINLFLIDYEFLDSVENGLDLIASLKIQKNAILITSRYGEIPILNRTTEMQVKMIPKGLAGLVPISMH
jgi:signal transduction histidine kinase/FtsZ-binding cell division protein ZapB